MLSFFARKFEAIILPPKYPPRYRNTSRVRLRDLSYKPHTQHQRRESLDLLRPSWIRLFVLQSLALKTNLMLKYGCSQRLFFHCTSRRAASGRKNCFRNFCGVFLPQNLKKFPSNPSTLNFEKIMPWVRVGYVWGGYHFFCDWIQSKISTQLRIWPLLIYLT